MADFDSEEKLNPSARAALADALQNINEPIAIFYNAAAICHDIAALRAVMEDKSETPTQAIGFRVAGGDDDEPPKPRTTHRGH